MKLHATSYHTTAVPDVEIPLWLFWCPGCEMVHNLDERWTVTGTPENPTVKPSYLQGGSRTDLSAIPRCHLFISDGHLQYLSDCSHAMAGQTVPMPELPKWAYSTDYEE